GHATGRVGRIPSRIGKDRVETAPEESPGGGQALQARGDPLSPGTEPSAASEGTGDPPSPASRSGAGPEEARPFHRSGKAQETRQDPRETSKGSELFITDPLELEDVAGACPRRGGPSAERSVR